MKMLSIHNAHKRLRRNFVIVVAGLFFPINVLAIAPPSMPVPATPQALLALHNIERTKLSLPLLSWDPKLEQDAIRYAKKLADENKFEHAPQAPDNDAQGENLWMGTRGFYKPADMVGSWIDERKLLRSGRFPKVSVTGDWTDVGHYTQLIWAKTKYVGCGIQHNKQDEFLVCRYYPAGNEYGEIIRVK